VLSMANIDAVKNNHIFGGIMKKQFCLILQIIFLFVLLAGISVNAYAQRCQAITKKGTQCKRQAQSGSIYCLQHARMYGGSSQPADTIVKKEIKKSERQKVTKSETIISTTATGKTLYQGPRGGIYHYSKSGKKVYHKRK